MPTPTYAVGSVVMHPTKQEWGRGLIEAVDRNRVLVHWDGRTEAASWMHVDHVPLPLADDQTAPVFKRRPAVRKTTSRPRAKAAAPKGNYNGMAPTADADVVSPEAPDEDI